MTDAVAVPLLPAHTVQTEQLWDFQFLYETITLLIYIYVLYIIISSKKAIFRSAFYTLFVIAGLFDVTLAACHAFYRIAKRTGLCSEWDTPLRTAYVIINSFYLIHISINIMITVNQLTVVILPLTHHQIWLRRRYLSVVLFMVVVCLASHIHVAFIPRTFTVINGFCSSKIDYGFMGIVTAIFVIIYEFNCLVLGPISVHKALKLKQKQNNSRKEEVTLAFFTVIDGICYLCELTYELTKALNIPAENSWLLTAILNNVYAYFYFLIVVNGMVLLILSGTLRKEIRSRWMGIGPGTASTLVGPVTTITQANKTRTQSTIWHKP